jgi:hypothetical protein
LGAREILDLSCAVCRYTNGPFERSTGPWLCCSVGKGNEWSRGWPRAGYALATLARRWPTPPRSPPLARALHPVVSRANGSQHTKSTAILSLVGTHTFSFPHTHRPGTGALTQSAIIMHGHKSYLLAQRGEHGDKKGVPSGHSPPLAPAHSHWPVPFSCCLLQVSGPNGLVQLDKF